MPIIFAILLGYLIGSTLYDLYLIPTIPTFSEENKIYIFQTGAYKTEEKRDEAIKDLTNKGIFCIYISDDLYKIYIAITSSEETKKIIQTIFKNEGIDAYVKEETTKNQEFYSELISFDNLIKSTTKKETILAIQKIILEHYKELFDDKEKTINDERYSNY